jgi:hypothetical protein
MKSKEAKVMPNNPRFQQRLWLDLSAIMHPLAFSAKTITFFERAISLVMSECCRRSKSTRGFSFDGNSVGGCFHFEFTFPGKLISKPGNN